MLAPEPVALCLGGHRDVGKTLRDLEFARGRHGVEPAQHAESRLAAAGSGIAEGLGESCTVAAGPSAASQRAPVQVTASAIASEIVSLRRSGPRSRAAR